MDPFFLSIEAVLAMPKAMFSGHFLHEDLYLMAAAYLYHIALNHPFVDGNKRVGLASAITFLDINEITVIADEESSSDLVLAVAEGKIDKAAIATFLRENTQ